METLHQGRRVRTRTIALLLAAMLALALALAVSRVVVSSGGAQPSTGGGHTTTTSVPYVLAPDAKDRNDRVSQPVESPSQPPPDDGRLLPH